MNRLQKNIACLVALAFMPSPKAAAEPLSYGIKVGGATSFMLPDGKEQKEAYKELSIKHSAWNPSLAAALYMAYDFNDHIGLGAEVLYGRFDSVQHQDFTKLGQEGKYKMASAILQGMGHPTTADAIDEILGKMVGSSKTATYIHTIGLPVVLAWSWTALLGPDFKKDYFQGRIFMGFHPFWLMSRTVKVKSETGKEASNDIPFGKSEPRYRHGLIGGVSFEFPNGLLVEIKGIAPYNFEKLEDKKQRPNVKAFHLSVGYNFATLY